MTGASRAGAGGRGRGRARAKTARGEGDPASGRRSAWLATRPGRREAVRHPGTFAADGSSIGGITFEGVTDTRPLAPLIDDTGDPDAICNLALSFGTTCEVCPSDGEPYCLPVRMDSMNAPQIPRVTLTEVATGDSLCACGTGTPVVSLAWTGLFALARRRRRTAPPRPR